MAGFSALTVTAVVSELSDGTLSRKALNQRWLAAVAQRVSSERPDIKAALTAMLEVDPSGTNLLKGLSIGEISVCYEALLATLDRGARKAAGQFFTPDDAAAFMAGHAKDFPSGVWLDPCCGVGNLAWHLAAIMHDAGAFVREQLVLSDLDPVALKTAIALISAQFAGPNDVNAVQKLAARSQHRDFLDAKPIPAHDFVIVNPPYARAMIRNEFETAEARDLFAYFLERIVKNSRGFIAVTPAAYLSAPKYQSLRTLFENEVSGGDVYVFDNVPDTLFRGYKFGSTNTSKTNFVRAAITVCSPNVIGWRTTPILRWKTQNRAKMFQAAATLLTTRLIGPHGEWTKLPPGAEAVWRNLNSAPKTVADYVSPSPTEFALTVALTPRYYISAAYRDLNRGSKAVLYFNSDEDRNQVAAALNSSIPYLWWRALDGGVNLPLRVLMSVKIPEVPLNEDIMNQLRDDEPLHLTTKLNAGRQNENIKRPAELVAALDRLLLPGDTPDLSMIYQDCMFTR